MQHTSFTSRNALLWFANPVPLYWPKVITASSLRRFTSSCSAMGPNGFVSPFKDFSSTHKHCVNRGALVNLGRYSCNVVRKLRKTRSTWLKPWSKIFHLHLQCRNPVLLFWLKKMKTKCKLFQSRGEEKKEWKNPKNSNVVKLLHLVFLRKSSEGTSKYLGWGKLEEVSRHSYNPRVGRFLPRNPRKKGRKECWITKNLRKFNLMRLIVNLTTYREIWRFYKTWQAQNYKSFVTQTTTCYSISRH